MPKHQIAAPHQFNLRQPVLEACSSLEGRWKVVDSGKFLEVDLPLSSDSPHERDAIEFALNPRVTGKDIFGGLDRDKQRVLATVIYNIFG